MVLENTDLISYDYPLSLMSSINTCLSLMKGKFRDDKFYLTITKELVGLTATRDRLDEIESLSRKMIDFYVVFDRWHCGLNQLK